MMHGDKSKQLVGPMMQLQLLINGQSDVEKSLNRSLEANAVLEAVFNEIDNKLVMEAGSLSDKEKADLEKELGTFRMYRVDVLFNI
jgi:hypothetical protein